MKEVPASPGITLLCLLHRATPEVTWGFLMAGLLPTLLPWPRTFSLPSLAGLPHLHKEGFQTPYAEGKQTEMKQHGSLPLQA